LATDNLEHELEARHPVVVNGGGVYLPWGIVAEVSRREKVHVSTWNVAYRKRRFIFCHDDTLAS
jgi:hypothetical protein